MAIIIIAKNKHAIVLAVKMLSFIKTYVITAKTIFETPNPKSFDAHSSPVEATIFLMASQKHIPIGTANKKLDNIILSFHQPQTNCELN